MLLLSLRSIALSAVILIIASSQVCGQSRVDLLYEEGMSLKDEKQYLRGYAKLDSCATLAAETKNWSQWAEARIKAGTCLGKKGRALEAVRYFESTRSQLSEKFDSEERLSFQIRLDKSMGHYYKQLNAMDLALRHFLDVFNAQEELKVGESDLARSCLNIGVAMSRKNDLSQASAYLKRGLQYAEGNPPYQSKFQTNLGMVALASGDPVAAEYAFRKAYDLRLQFTPDDDEGLGGALLFLASAALGAGEDSTAQEYLLKAHSHLIQCLDCNELWGDYYTQYSQLKTAAGDPQSALEDGLMAVQYFEMDPFLQRQWAIQQIENGRLYLELDSIKEAEGRFRKALAAFLPSFLPESESNAMPQVDSLQTDPWIIEGLKGLSDASYLRYKQNPKDTDALEKSMEYLNLAVEQASNIRRAFVSPDARLGLTGKVYSLFELAIVRALELEKAKGDQSYRALAFSLAEQGKSAVLLEEIAAADMVSGQSMSGDLQDQLAELDLNYRIFRECAQSAEGPRAQECQFKSDSALRARGELLLQIRDQYPAYFSARYQAPILSVDTLQLRLGEEEALIEYFLGDANLVIFAMTRDKFEVIRQPLPEDLVNNIRALRSSITTNGSSKALKDFRTYGRKLYQQIVEPWAALLSEKVKAVTIVPDGLLSYLPFEVLLDEDPREKIYPQLPYLIYKYRFSYAYSATLRYRNRAAVRVDKTRVLACALSFSEDMAGTTRGSIDREDLSALPNATEEAKAIGERFDGSFLLDGEATESAFREQAPNFGILHLATHTIFNDSNPDATRIVFANEEGQNDGYLHAYELYGLSLNADLAVLSACQTGDGELLRGEGVMSLGRAFTYAGCRSTVITLWPLNDEASGTIMADFYRYLSKGLPKDEALHEAKLNYLNAQNGPKANPFYWAAYIQTGEKSAVSKQSWIDTAYRYAPIGGVPILLLLVILFFRRRARKSKHERIRLRKK